MKICIGFSYRSLQLNIEIEGGGCGIYVQGLKQQYLYLQKLLWELGYKMDKWLCAFNRAFWSEYEDLDIVF
jgi:hypothetical protein